MLAVSAVLLAAVTLFLLEGSFLFYRLPGAPMWLQRRKGLQATLSSLLSIGFIAALFMMGQYFVDFGDKPFNVLDIILIGAVAAMLVVAMRWLRAVERRMAGADAMVETKPDADGFRRAA